MAHGPKGKARAEVGQGKGWEEDVEDLWGFQEGDATSPPSCPKWEFHSLPMQVVCPTHLKEPWDKGLMNPQLRTACTLGKQQ